MTSNHVPILMYSCSVQSPTHVTCTVYFHVLFSTALGWRGVDSDSAQTGASVVAGQHRNSRRKPHGGPKAKRDCRRKGNAKRVIKIIILDYHYIITSYTAKVLLEPLRSTRSFDQKFWPEKRNVVIDNLRGIVASLVCKLTKVRNKSRWNKATKNDSRLMNLTFLTMFLYIYGFCVAFADQSEKRPKLKNE